MVTTALLVAAAVLALAAALAAGRGLWLGRGGPWLYMACGAGLLAVACLGAACAAAGH